MAYSRDLNKWTGERLEKFCGARISYILDDCIVIEGYKRIIKCTENCIVIQYNSQLVTVTGRGLAVCSVNCKEMVVKGNFDLIAIERN